MNKNFKLLGILIVLMLITLGVSLGVYGTIEKQYILQKRNLKKHKV